MATKENKILEELRRRGTIFEDPCPKSEGFIGKPKIRNYHPIHD